MTRLAPGSRVVVEKGRWAGRVGTLLRYDRPPGTRLFPVVELDPAGGAPARTVRVWLVADVAAAPPPWDDETQREVYEEVTWARRNHIRILL